METRTGLRIPTDIWQLIREQMPKTELNLLCLIRVSEVSKSARQVFSSDKSWKILNPYGFKDQFHRRFCELANNLSPQQQRLLRLSWSWGKRYCLTSTQKMQNKQENYTTETHPICSQGLKAWGYSMDDIRGIHVDPNVNLYTKMGILFPDCYNLLEDKIDDPVFLNCLIHHHPGAIRIASPDTPNYADLRFLALMQDFAQGGLCCLTLEDVPDATNLSKEQLIELLKVNPSNLEFIHGENACDYDIVLAAVSNDGKVIEMAPDCFKYDIGMNVVALNAIDYDEWLEHLEGPMMEIPEIAEVAVKNTDYGYTKLPKHLREDSKYCHLAVASNGRHLKRLPVRCRGDHDIVLAAVMENGLMLKYAEPTLRSDKEIVVAAVKNNGQALRFAHNSLTEDRDVVLAAVTTWGPALQFAIQFNNDRELVKRAIIQDGNSLKYACDSLRDDVELATLALSTGGEGCLGYCAERLKKKRSVVMATVKSNGLALGQLSDFHGDMEVVDTAVKNTGLALQFAADELRNDSQLVLAAVESAASALQFASHTLRSDFLFTLKCVRRNHESMAFAASNLQNNPLWVHKAVELTIV